MTYEKETLKLLRQSLDDEDDETTIIPIIMDHHKYIKEYVSVFMDDEIGKEEKQSTARLFVHVFNMHGNAENEIFYKTVKDSPHSDLSQVGRHACEQHELACELVKELNEMGFLQEWTREIESKIRVLARVLTNQLTQEEGVVFPLAEKIFSEAILLDLADDYLDKCKKYFDLEITNVSSEVSRSDVMAFL